MQIASLGWRGERVFFWPTCPVFAPYAQFLLYMTSFWTQPSLLSEWLKVLGLPHTSSWMDIAQNKRQKWKRFLFYLTKRFKANYLSTIPSHLSAGGWFWSIQRCQDDPSFVEYKQNIMFGCWSSLSSLGIFVNHYHAHGNYLSIIIIILSHGNIVDITLKVYTLGL